MKNNVYIAVGLSSLMVILSSIAQYLIGYQIEEIAPKLIHCLVTLIILLCIDRYSKEDANHNIVSIIAICIALYLLGSPMVDSEYNFFSTIKSSWHLVLALITFVLILNLQLIINVPNLLAKLYVDIKKIRFG